MYVCMYEPLLYINDNNILIYFTLLLAIIRCNVDTFTLHLWINQILMYYLFMVVDSVCWGLKI